MYQSLFFSSRLPLYLQHTADALKDLSGLFCSVQISDDDNACHSQIKKKNIIIARDILQWPTEVSIWVLAHEWGHCALNHTKPLHRLETREECRKYEIEADIYSAFFMARYQVNVDRTKAFFQDYLNEDHEEPHLGGRERFLLIKKYYQISNEVIIRNHQELMDFTIQSAIYEYEILLNTPGIFIDRTPIHLRY